MSVALPLFRKQELDRLKERREALLKRVQSMPKYSHGRQEKIGQLKAVTAEIIDLEQELYGRRD